MESKDSTAGSQAHPPAKALRAGIWLPCLDQAVSERFYTGLCGPPVERAGGFVLFRLAETMLWLQDFYVKDWAENTVLYVGVEDADAWHRQLESMRSEFPDLRIEGPVDQDWGHRMVTTWDPAGVLLHFAAAL